MARRVAEYLQYGGQAVIEGVMMRSPRYFAIACRKADGTICVTDEAIEASFIGRLKWLNRPFLRGTLALIDAMTLGMKALSYSANVQIEEEAKPASARDRRISDTAIGGTFAFAFAAGLGLFVALPTLLTQAVQGAVGAEHGVVRNAIDGLIRLTIFISYVALISLMANVKRVFQYHGAEHKVINTLEEGHELDLASSLGASRIHPRCGTSFVVVVLIASFVVHSVFPRPDNALIRIAVHLALVPVVAGISYEIIKLAGRLRSAWLLKVILAPGLWSQRLTTREPSDDQVEVALAALRRVLDREQGSANLPATGDSVA